MGGGEALEAGRWGLALPLTLPRISSVILGEFRHLLSLKFLRGKRVKTIYFKYLQDS